MRGCKSTARCRWVDFDPTIASSVPQPYSCRRRLGSSCVPFGEPLSAPPPPSSLEARHRTEKIVRRRTNGQ